MTSLRKAALLLFAALLVTVMAACSKDNQGSEKEGETPAPAVVSELSRDPIEMTFYGGQSNWTDEMFWSLYGNAIKAKFPYVTMKFLPNPSNPLEAYIMGGGQFDFSLVTISGMFNSIYKYGIEMDISDVLKSRNINLDHLDSNFLSMQRDMAKGGIHGLPGFVQFPIMVYNRDLFNKFGVPFPQANATWDDTYQLATRLSRDDGGVKYYGLMTNLTFQLKTSQIPLKLVDPQTNKATSDDKVRRVLENFSRFYRISGFEATEAQARGGGIENMFLKDQTLAMWPHFTNVTRRLPAEVNWDVQNLPYYSDNVGLAPALDPYYVAVTNMTKHKEHAVEIAAFLTTIDVQKNLAMEGFTPVIKDKEVQDVFGKNNPAYTGKNHAAFFPTKHAEGPPYSRYYSLADSTLLQEFAKYAVNAKDINTALRDYTEAANKKIEEEMKTAAQ